MPFQIGDLIDGHYRVEQRFAGGMGFVYIVLDEIVKKRSAIKQLAELHAANDVLLERFRREASTWLQLDYHPHIVQAHSFLPRPEAPMLILEYVDGPSIELLLRTEKRLSPVQVLRYARQFCSAMMHAHSCEVPGRGVGVLHRDIKPGNILLTRTNQLKVTDFGLAKIEGDASITSHGQFVGTVAYSSPEQLRSAGAVTRASDVYSFGAVLYQALSGHPPFQGKNAAELFYAIQETEPKPVGDFSPELSESLAEVVMRCLKKPPTERPETFRELDAALAAIHDVAVQPSDYPCGHCGFVSRRKTAKCSVCGRATADPRAQTQPPKSKKWKCGCGAMVSLAAEKCGKCGGARPAAAGVGSDPDRAWSGSDPSKPPLLPPLSAGPMPVAGTARVTWDLEADKEYLVELRAGGFLLPWPLDRSGYTVGRDTNMKIRIDDPSVGRYHMFLIRLPCGWLAMNPAPNERMDVNGWTTRQHMLRAADLIRLGTVWLVYAGPPVVPEPLAPIPGRWIERVGPKAPTVKSGGSTPTQVQPATTSSCALEIAGGGKYISRGQPLRVGTSPLSEVRLDDPSAAPVQALLMWQADGPHLINLTEGLVRTISDDIFEDRLLADGDLLQIGATPVRVRVTGDPLAPARMLAAAAAATTPRLAVTILTGDGRGQTAIVATGQPLTLGRLPDGDFVISADPFVSRRHLELLATESEINIKDVAHKSGFFVNQTHFADTGVARLGDVLVVGKTSMLVHYELDFE